MEVLAASNWQSLEPLLLITFTNKATLEMKQSLFAAIKTRLQSAKNDAEKKRWKMLLANFNDNSIMTIDALFRVFGERKWCRPGDRSLLQC
jgi:ATP-dependent exoDNAse (exonuclease V) beta subunit